MSNEHGPLGKAWIDIGSDVNWTDYGGRWARHIGGTRYHVIRFENAEEWSQTGYHCDLQVVDLTDERLDGARQFSGYAGDWCDEYGDPLPDLAKAEALSSYGAYETVWQRASGNAWELIREARRVANNDRKGS